MGLPDKAAEQLVDWKKKQGNKEDRMVSPHGVPLASLSKTLTVGPRGPVLLQDSILVENLAHWERERIPERVVHAKGAGAFGYFEVTHDITKYSKAKIFEKIGKKTPVAIRFSTVAGESGSADTLRDPRGFAVKFYTEDGNWDLTGNNTPIFFVRDPLLFPSFIRSQKRNPQTHLKDANMFWDFISLRPECLHQTAFLFSDRGIPDGYRHMNGYGSHTFKLVNARGDPVYCKFHFKTDQGIKNLRADRAHQLAADDPDYAIHDLYNAIANSQYPSWTLHIQVMTFDQAEKFRWNPFDLTKVWPQGEFPLIPVGKLVLNRNPENYFACVEQLAFSPANMPPGIEPSPDKMLQARLLAYVDTHRHRLGANYEMLSVNCPATGIKRANYIRDGPMTTEHQGGAPNYFPNSFSGPVEVPEAEMSVFSLSGDVKRYEFEADNYEQVDTFWTKVLKPDERKRLVENMAAHLKNALPFIQERVVRNFGQVNAEFEKMLREELKRYGSSNL